MRRWIDGHTAIACVSISTCTQASTLRCIQVWVGGALVLGKQSVQCDCFTPPRLPHSRNRSTSGLGKGDGINNHTDKWLSVSSSTLRQCTGFHGTASIAALLSCLLCLQQRLRATSVPRQHSVASTHYKRSVLLLTLLVCACVPVIHHTPG